MKRFYDWLLPITPIRWLGGARVSVPYYTEFALETVAELDDISPQEPMFEEVIMTKEVYEYRLEMGLLT